MQDRFAVSTARAPDCSGFIEILEHNASATTGVDRMAIPGQVASTQVAPLHPGLVKMCVAEV